jgi:ComF family protein
MANTPLKAKISSFILDILFPKICVVCAKEGASICDACIALLEPLPFSFCPSCSKKTIEGRVDGSCRDNGVRISRFFSALPYKNIYVKTLMQHAKYPPHYAKELLEDAAKILNNFLDLQKFGELIAPLRKKEKIIIIPVPLHRKKLRGRSFNQAEIIARAISSKFSIPMDANTLIRHRETKSQTKMKPLERTINILDAFVVRIPDVVRGKTVILVDDVYTSGSTINECARVLLKAGAKTIWGITLAR